jgi:23S rRNA pseudouridine1911/1915/1917 synthase
MNAPIAHFPHIFTVTKEHEETRLDLLLARILPDYSRSYFQKCIREKRVMVNSILVEKHSYQVKEGDIVHIAAKPCTPLSPSQKNTAQIAVEIVYEHEHFLVLEKPAGLIVHAPHPEFEGVTLVDWLLNRFSGIECIGEQERPGIIHRLDKETSGLILIAKTPYGHTKLSNLFKDRQIKKTYLAIVEGHPNPASGSIDFSIDRHRLEPHKMTHLSGSGRDALTHYTVLETLSNSSLLEARPVTGRTHQIRVHCAAIGHPIVGDVLYGHYSKRIRRQALHAASLTFRFDGQDFSFKSELPYDMQRVIKETRLYADDLMTQYEQDEYMAQTVSSAQQTEL